MQRLCNQHSVRRLLWGPCRKRAARSFRFFLWLHTCGLDQALPVLPLGLGSALIVKVSVFIAVQWDLDMVLADLVPCS